MIHLLLCPQILSLTSVSLLKGMGNGNDILNVISKMRTSSSCEVLVFREAPGSRDSRAWSG